MTFETIIDDKSKISLFAVAAAIPILGAFAFWLTAQHVNAEHIQQKVENLEQKNEKHYELLLAIKDDVLVIKESLKKQNKNQGE
jgi:hypothetical protein